MMRSVSPVKATMPSVISSDRKFDAKSSGTYENGVMKNCDWKLYSSQERDDSANTATCPPTSTFTSFTGRVPMCLER